MARDGSGTFSLVAGNPVVTGTVISSTVHNATMSDIATALTNSVAKNGETVITGSIDYNGNKLILDADADTSITADTDDQIDVEIAGADDFRFVANVFRALSGSSVETNTINETTAASGVTIDSVLLKDGNVVLGNGNGIDFAATTDGTTMGSELLDDYEEGTFTPTLLDSSLSAGEGQTYATDGQKGWYQKIGNHVFFRIRLAMAGLGTLTAGDAASIGGLPFTHLSATSQTSPIYVGTGSGLSITAGHSLSGWINSNTAYIQLTNWDATTGVTNALISEITAAGVLILGGHYQVNT